MAPIFLSGIESIEGASRESNAAAPSYHSRIMNIQIPDGEPRKRRLDYKYGHKDARHAAAEIALQADRRIGELELRVRVSESGQQESERLYSQCVAALEKMEAGRNEAMRRVEDLELSIHDSAAETASLEKKLANETEACAKIVDERVELYKKQGNLTLLYLFKYCADDIRARSVTQESEVKTDDNG